MKLLIDHNLSPKLVQLLGDDFPGTLHLTTLGMDTQGDLDIWDYARDHGFAILTKDKDFYQRSTLLGHPPKVVHITIGNCPVGDAASAILNRVGHVKNFLKNSTRSYLILQ